MCEKLPEAIAEFERAVNLNPKFALSLVQKIYAEYRKAVMDRDVSKINSAKSALKRAVAKNPTCSEGYMLLAQVSLSELKKITIIVLFLKYLINFITLQPPGLY